MTGIKIGIVLCGAFFCYAYASPVVTSIKPLYALTKSIAGDRVDVALLLPAQQSAHGAALKPSQAQLLHGKDLRLIVWIGPSYEGFLRKPIQHIGKDVAVVQADNLDLPLKLPPGDCDCEHHDHGAIDGHVWLSPDNAIVIVKAIAAALIKLYPQHAAFFAAQLRTVTAEITATRDEIRHMFAGKQGRAFVFHDAYRYFFKALMPAGADYKPITVRPEVPLGPRDFQSILQQITDAPVPCLFGEPQFNTDRLRKFMAGQRPDTVWGQLDPLGGEAADDDYNTLLKNMAYALKNCGAYT